MLNGLDLFSGIGGISLALQPWVRTVCYVEIDRYCQAVIQARIADGRLHDAPIWDDVRTFDPGPWIGAVDIVSGGFPCQDISAAGRGAGLAGERSGLFFEIVRLCGVIRPRYIFLENVAAITAGGRGGWDVIGALTALGYDCRWGVLSAFDMGAPHRRDRWWCLAADRRHIDGLLQSGRWIGQGGPAETAQPAGHGRQEPLAHTQKPRDRQLPARSRADRQGTPNPERRCAAMAYPATSQPERTREGNQGAGWAPFGPGGGGSAEWWATEPDVGRVAHGVPARVDRIAGLGNSVVPSCAREAFTRLMFGSFR